MSVRSGDSVHSSDSGSDDSNHDTQSHDHASQKDGSVSMREQLGLRETRAVLRLRILVIVVLLTASAAVSAVVYKTTKRSETEEFKTQYSGAAQKIVDTFGGIVEQKFGAISSMGVATIAHGVDHVRTWPRVTLSSFQQRAGTAKTISGALFVGLAPYVKEEDRRDWEEYVVSDDAYWVEEGLVYQEDHGVNNWEERRRLQFTSNQSLPIYYSGGNGTMVTDPGPGPYLPVWETSPVLKSLVPNLNIFQENPYFEGRNARKCLESGQVIIGSLRKAPAGDSLHSNPLTSFYASLLSINAKEKVRYEGDPMSNVYMPIFNSFEEDRVPVAVLISTFSWAFFWKNVLPPTSKGITVVLDNGCDEAFTYEVIGKEVTLVGPGDQHDSKFDYLRLTTDLSENLNIADGTKSGLPLTQNECPVKISIFPSQTYEDVHTTATPAKVTSAVALVLVFAVLMFLVYDRLVERRQRIVLNKALTTSALVSSLFPSKVANQLLKDEEEAAAAAAGTRKNGYSKKGYLQSFLADEEEVDIDSGFFKGKPICDLYPESTILFADLAGFTAWSSVREPVQVFQLLETLYHAFDEIARRRRVFKVETVGDCYVACCGLPVARKDHAVVMARFARDIVRATSQLTKKLELMLGPDTADLAMRVGLHSGPVTAGVLRGEKSRFQLFGDTMNTAARMESNGKPSKIHISEETAQLLVTAGKSSWVVKREDKISAKGKGEMQTFWLLVEYGSYGRSSSVGSGTSDSNGDTAIDCEAAVAQENDVATRKGEQDLSVKMQRLVQWNASCLLQKLEDVVAKRDKGKLGTSQGGIPADVTVQLTSFVEEIARRYHDNPFHNFEHASHVTMSVTKLLSRVVSVDDDDASKNYQKCIKSDALIQFAVIFSALIHDVDHLGVPNIQLAKEKPDIAAKYESRSIAENNSINVAWELFLKPDFSAFRQCVAPSNEDLEKFYATVVNVTLATDIVDKELKADRNARWEHAFSESAGDKGDELKVRIVLEHLIQASDVCHTMQHWHVYRKWNERLFLEMYKAFREGRAASNPAEFWYKGEIGFFDFYIIPLAKKLKECEVFGVSSDEYRIYAEKNRAEWEKKGQEVVEAMVEKFRGEYDSPRTVRV